LALVKIALTVGKLSLTMGTPAVGKTSAGETLAVETGRGASREGTLGDDSWGMAEVLAMFSLCSPASKLETVGKASHCLSSLERDAGLSALEVENHVELNKQIEVIGVPEVKVCDGTRLGLLSLHPV
nr:hypothetical protein [Tanacetum cinerariifolium]